MISAYQLAVLAAGVFFLNALITGVWKYLQISASENARAHPYVDIAHRASLLYSFAAMLLATFVQISQLPEQVEFVAVLLPLIFFALAIASYMRHGFLQKTDNQLRGASSLVTLFMWMLIIAEIGGFCVLFAGVIMAIF